ncbi:ADP-ribose pyrophosphatase [Fructilactobacillus sanfranciscensis]|uniref:NUDIX hydrolase n=1 Tax=Fructilactobacillus sanfranciscensis TaxID=1625 RepID=UPI000CD3F24D|nr:NUDIX hydrolase [Fructilactobacillus sanfranciscensis]MCG7194684.1 NUDIX domain-containing protein [Fructilactobacillus sanfranciscensis]MCG7195919.1 NUDIX domain-containing protein [Fructilactobacillus sanfranciscensis]POH13107.1 ADP-ribose pyrophosphatase [Fructilactobacillus sanfranciscensis]
MADYIKELRALVGHRSLILNTSAGALLNDKQELLLQERTGNDDWCFPGGFMEFGETLFETCKREFEEDSGVEIEPVTLLKTFDTDIYTYPNGDQTQLITNLFLVKKVSGHLLDHRTEETSDLRYFALDNLPHFFNEQSEKMAQAVIDYVEKNSK